MKNLKGITTAAIIAVVFFGSYPAVASLALTDFSNGGSGSLYTASGSGSQVIPDYPGAGVAYSLNFAAGGLNISSISVSLNVSGGFNGDIYAYLSHGSQISYLLSGDGAASGSGMNLTFVEGTGNPIPTGGSGTLVGSSYTAFTDLSTFNNTDPSGSWTLFFADRSSADTSTLTGFSIGITAVPEPVNVALGVFGVVLVGTVGIRRFQQTRKVAAP